MISKRTEYGLKALIYLARQYNRGPVLIADLAQEERIPKKFLEAILLVLKNNGLLRSKKGKGGGYYLSRSPKEVTFGLAIRAIEGPIAPVPCIGENRYQCDKCDNELTCGIRLVMQQVRDAISGILDRTTLADVLYEIDKAEALQLGGVNFCI